MPIQQAKRHEEYLQNYHFFPNSIEFRIISSKALEKWKNIQAFQLNQLINGKFFFPQDRREILLLKYDMWSRWLYEIENMFIELHETNDLVRQKDIDAIIDLAEKTAEVYEHIIIEEHAHHFKPEFSNIWVKSHSLIFKLFIEEIRKMHGSYEEVFTKITDILCEVQQYTLTEIHEINEMFNNPKSDNIFLVVSDFCVRVYKETGNCITAARAETYSKYFPFKKVWFKNYTDHSLPKQLIDNVQEKGFEIDFQRTVFN